MGSRQLIMSAKIGLTLSWFFCCISLQGQYATGLLLDQSTYQSTPEYFINVGAKSTTVLENAELRTMSLKPYCPRPRIQGEMASCSGWAAGYAALTIANAVRGQWPQRGISPSDSAYSSLFVYNQIKVGSCNGGSSLIDALRFLQKNGNVHYRDFDAKVQECQTQPAFGLVISAQRSRIKDYFKIFEVKDQHNQKIEKVKQCLRQKSPVIVAINLLENFKLLNRSNPIWFPKIGNTSPMGAHAMVIIGYDDVRKAFEVMNSWGEAWGDQGFGWIRYEDFSQFAQFGFLFTLPDSASSVSVLYGGAILRRLIGTSDNTLLFDTMKVQRQNQVYRIAQTISTADKIQLVLEHSPNNVQVYPLSFFIREPAKKYAVPQNQAVISPMVIPSLYRAIQFTQTGRQWLVLCISKAPIAEDEWLKKIICGANCSAELFQHWGCNSLEFNWSNTYAGGIDLTKNQQVLPLIFEINVQ